MVGRVGILAISNQPFPSVGWIPFGDLNSLYRELKKVLILLLMICIRVYCALRDNLLGCRCPQRLAASDSPEVD